MRGKNDNIDSNDGVSLLVIRRVQCFLRVYLRM